MAMVFSVDSFSSESKIPFRVIVPASTKEVSFGLMVRSTQENLYHLHILEATEGQHILFIKAVQGDGQV